MDKRLDLTKGHIGKSLFKLALPIMGTSFIQMAYNIIDMMWVGKDGSVSVAAVGTAGFYTWLAMAFIMFSRIGGEVKVAQSIGKKDIKSTKEYVKAAIELNIIFSIIYTSVMIIFNKPLIELFRLGDIDVINKGRQYLVIVSLSMIFYFINPVFTSIFNGIGNSKTPFIINTIGLVANIILDPILIFGIGPFMRMGVKGAALATAISQLIVSSCFVIKIVKDKIEFFKNKYFRNIELKYYKILFDLGLPVALQEGLFTAFSMAMGVIVARFGPVAIAAQKVGTQIESISWTSAEGLAASLSSFVGQNYGAKKYDRIKKGSRFAIISAVIWGLFTTSILVFLCRPLFSLFINESDAINKGADYLRILGYSQLFMCIEITIGGIFKGIGRTNIPSYISIILTGSRIPMALILSKESLFGLNGIWWSISVSSIFKGIILLSIFVILNKKNKFYKEDFKRTA
ncbi:putative efflux protein, MATE family [Clostridium sp. DSM 8431]|uniref:MATE family efflux transporter n=1 Tax=Clostridium sp. DSM 8431 TaxID=1761781 RepID=UPI0008E8EB7E|nr:MATE family efflux transporter [Clostridium sp. DSM 8431]SFU70431.1 putative efflux protein, MATE family [Clostridium sp. DSM 8431]